MSYFQPINRTAATASYGTGTTVSVADLLNGFISITGATPTITLPTSAVLAAAIGNTEGLQVFFRRLSTGVATITRGGADTINLATTTTLATLGDVTVLTLQGTDWQIS